MILPTPFLVVAVLLLGLVVGSFLNVCIHRVPREKSVVAPRSACPHCEHPIAFYDNIPVFSFIMLGGKCRRCKAPISWQYPAVEAGNALLWLLVFWKFGPAPWTFGPSLTAVLYIAFVSAMLVLALIDASNRILPHGITLSGLVLGFLTAPWQAIHQEQQELIAALLSLLGPAPQSGYLLGWTSSFLGILVGGGLLASVALGYYALKKKEGMGHGDIVMMAFVGAVLGWRLTFLTIFLGSVLGIFGWFALSRRDREYEIPFGTFLAAGAILALFIGDPLMNWYWGRLGG